MRMFSKVRYWTSKALYSPRGSSHFRVTSVSVIFEAFIPVIGSGSATVNNCLKFGHSFAKNINYISVKMYSKICLNNLITKKYLILQCNI